MSCQDDANFMGPVSLFVGIESVDWSIQDFVSCANFAQQHGISTLIIKVAEAGGAHPDIWYGGIAGFDVIYQKIKHIINVLTYQFCYGGSNLSRDIDIATQFLTKYGCHCLDIEGTAWEGSAAASSAQQFGNALQAIPGKLWLSHPSDFAENNQSGSIGGFATSTNVFMPMVYSNSLASRNWMAEIQSVNASPCVQPTLDLSQEFGANDPLAIAKQCKAGGCLAISLWEYQFALNHPGVVDQIVQVYGGAAAPPPPMEGTLKLDNNGCVVTTTKSFQLESGESGDLCGPWSATALAYSVPPGQTPVETAEQIDVFTDTMVDTLFGPGGFNHINFGGVMPADMLTILNYIRDTTGLLHYWVIPGNLIAQAVAAGYPCLFSCNEADITAWNKSNNAWEHAYPWQLSAGHVLPVTGIEKGTGNWICPDQLNNSYQGYWPVIYKASDIQKSLSWAVVIQLVGPDKNNPWLAPIPDPSKPWPSNFNAQNFGGSSVTTSPQPATDWVKMQADDCWNSNTVGAPSGTGIYQAWLADWRNSVRHGPPISKEYSSHDYSSKGIILQNFAGCLARWPGDGNAYFYNWS